MCRLPTTNIFHLLHTCQTCIQDKLFQVVVRHCEVQIILIKYYHFSYDVVPLMTTFRLHTASLRFSGNKVSSKLLVQIVTKNAHDRFCRNTLNIVCSWRGKVSWIDGQQSRLLQVQTRWCPNSPFGAETPAAYHYSQLAYCSKMFWLGWSLIGCFLNCTLGILKNPCINFFQSMELACERLLES